MLQFSRMVQVRLSYSLQMHTPGDCPSATVHPKAKIARGPLVRQLPATSMRPARITMTTRRTPFMIEHRAWDMCLSIEPARTSVKPARVKSNLPVGQLNSSRPLILIPMNKIRILYYPFCVVFSVIARLFYNFFFDSLHQKPLHLHRVNDFPCLINSFLIFLFSKLFCIQHPFCEAFQGVVLGNCKIRSISKSLLTWHLVKTFCTAVGKFSW